MNIALNRRGLLRLLPMAPAMAKELASDITKQAAGRAASLMHGPIPTSMVHGSPDGYEKARSTIMQNLRDGLIPKFKEYEYRSTALHRARWREDEDVEALHSISGNYRMRMHRESAYRRVVKEDLAEMENATVWQKFYKSFGVNW